MDISTFFNSGIIKSLIETCQDFDVPANEVKRKLMDKFQLTQEEAEAGINEFWKTKE